MFVHSSGRRADRDRSALAIVNVGALRIHCSSLTPNCKAARPSRREGWIRGRTRCAGGGPVTLAISVLGPLSLDRSGAPVELGGAKLRLLLGVLIAHRRSPLTPDQICDALWPQEQPRSATATRRRP